jgi:hypothetical protein
MGYRLSRAGHKLTKLRFRDCRKMCWAPMKIHEIGWAGLR